MASSRCQTGEAEPPRYSALPPMALPLARNSAADPGSLPYHRRPLRPEPGPTRHPHFEHYPLHSSFAAASPNPWDGPSTSRLDTSFLPLPPPVPSDEPLHSSAPPAPSEKPPERDPIRYSLHVLQQPHHACMGGNGAKADRRPIDPPPVLRLEMLDPSSSSGSVLQRSPYFVCTSTLCQSQPPYEELAGKPIMVGNTVSSPIHLREDDRVAPAGHYFLFSDLRIRVEGVYRLKFSMFQIVDEKMLLCATAMSEQFQVSSANKSPSMNKPTDLSSLLSHQCLRMRIRNESPSEAPPGPKKAKQAEANGGQTRKRKLLPNADGGNPPARPQPQPHAVKAGWPAQLLPLPHATHPHPLFLRSIVLPKLKISGEPPKHCTLPSIQFMLKHKED